MHVSSKEKDDTSHVKEDTYKTQTKFAVMFSLTERNLQDKHNITSLVT